MGACRKFLGLAACQASNFAPSDSEAARKPSHNQKLGYTAFPHSPHTGREKFATGPTKMANLFLIAYRFALKDRPVDLGNPLRHGRTVPVAIIVRSRVSR